MTVAMPGPPLTSVLITSLFLQADAVTLMPLVIVAVLRRVCEACRRDRAATSSSASASAGAKAAPGP